MNEYFLELTPRDGLIARDGRPFGAATGNRMRSLSWFYPSVLAGSLRSMLGKLAGGFDEQVVGELKGLGIAGPLPMLGQHLFFQAPMDCRVNITHSQANSFALRPANFEEGEGVDFPANIIPVLPPLEHHEEGKPEALDGVFWSIETMVQWLISPCGNSFMVPVPLAENRQEPGELSHIIAPQIDNRVHTKVVNDEGVVEEGMLFSTSALDLSINYGEGVVKIACRVQSEEYFKEYLASLAQLHPMGGERRLVHWQTVNNSQPWLCPSAVSEIMKGATRVRMVLATPGLFSKGWLPDWLDESTLEGKPPGVDVQLKLHSVCLGRWQALSGWSLEKGKRGPKPVRRMVPAGSVYFFSCEGDASLLETLWLKSVCDNEQDRRDGFALALWGIWQQHGQV